MLLGLLAVTSGRVELLGGPPDRERRRRLGYVPQGLGPVRRPDRAGEPVVRRAGLRRRGARAAARAAGLRRRPGRESCRSGAQRQVAFLAALAHAPEVLVLDEPTSGVDALARAALWDTIRGAGRARRRSPGDDALHAGGPAVRPAAADVATAGWSPRAARRDIIGATTAVAVRTEDWARAFAALNAAGAPVMLAGRAIRVANADPAGLAGGARRPPGSRPAWSRCPRRSRNGC